MSNEYYSDSGEVKDRARQQAGEVKDHAASEAGAVKDHAASEAGAVKDHAASEAGAVKDHATGAARDVAATAQTEAQSVARDAQTEIRGLVDSGLQELNTQMGPGQDRLANEVRNVVDELKEMVQGSQHDGLATQTARELSQRGDGLVSWLDSHEPRDAITEVRRYAARNPGIFLAIAAGAGLLVGRFARGLRDDNADDDSSDHQGTYSGRTSVGSGYSTAQRSGVYGYESGASYGGTHVLGQGEVTTTSGTGYNEGLGYTGTGAEGSGYRPGYTGTGAEGTGYRPGEAAQGYNSQFGEEQFRNPGERR